MRRYSTLLLLVPLFLLLFCERPVELKNRLIVQAVGVDWEDDSFQVTLQVFRSEESGQQGSFNVSKSNSQVYQGVGDTIAKALQQIEEQSGKRIFLGSNQVLMVGEKTADSRMAEAMSYFNGNHEIRPRTCVVVTEGPASDLVNMKVSEGLVPADALMKSMKISSENGTTIHGTLMTVMRAFQDPYGVSGVPFLAKTQDFEGKDSFENLGTILVDKNGIISSLDLSNTRGAAWLMRDIQGTVLILKDEEGNRFSLSARPGTPKINCTIVENQPVFHIELKAICSVPEALGGNRAGVSKAEVDKVRQMTENAIRGEIDGVLQECVVNKQADLFQFQQHLEKYQTAWWRENKSRWPSLLSDIRFEVAVKVEVRGLGLGHEDPAR